VTDDRELLASDWRRPYRSMDASGGPDTAETVGRAWIEAIAADECDVGTVFIESPRLGGDGRAIALYRGTDLLALASIFRDPMNFAVLVRWRADDAARAREEGRVEAVALALPALEAAATRARTEKVRHQVQRDARSPRTGTRKGHGEKVDQWGKLADQMEAAIRSLKGQSDG
jgi:hypothetical protein